MGLTGSLSRGFLYGLNRIEVVGLDRFLETLDGREDVDGRERGLVTGMFPSEAWEWNYADRIFEQYQIMLACTFSPAHISIDIPNPCSYNISAEWMILWSGAFFLSDTPSVRRIIDGV
jgi:hypothetical protein